MRVSSPAGNKVSVQKADNRIGQIGDLVDLSTDLVTGGDIVADANGTEIDAASGGNLHDHLAQVAIKRFVSSFLPEAQRPSWHRLGRCDRVRRSEGRLGLLAVGEVGRDRAGCADLVAVVEAIDLGGRRSSLSFSPGADRACW